MRLVLSTGEVIFCVCVVALALYLSPFFIDEVNVNASNAWEFLLVWDDEENFVHNEVIQGGLNLANLYAMFTMTKINVYEPFGWILKAVQAQFVGLDSWWIRIVSTALHFVAAAVLAQTSALLLDMMALLSEINAMVFAIHPVHVEVIAWPSAQPYTLCALFSNLALYVYVRAMYRKLCEVPIGKKNAMVMLMESIFGGGGRSDPLCCGYDDASLGSTADTLANETATALSAPPGDLSLANYEYLLSLSASMALVLLTIWPFRHRQAPQHLLALAYFAIMVLPVSGLIQHGIVSAGCDRYAYLCSIVVVPYGGSMLAQLFDDEEDNVKDIDDQQEPEQIQTRTKQYHAQHRAIGFGAVLLLAGTLLSISTSLMGHWRNEDALFEYSLRMDPTDWRILDQRATYFVTSGRYSSSDGECRRLWELTYYFTPFGTLKSDLQRLKLLIWLNGMDDVVCEGYMQLLEARPDNCHVHNNVGVCLIDQGKLSEARQEFVQALLCPGYEEL
ncbi:Tetratricopeptide-like helical domain [Phytophthora cactorum]|nr:Tetratricopeptide-like helical domain [Phytophthora cactorum]